MGGISSFMHSGLARAVVRAGQIPACTQVKNPLGKNPHNKSSRQVHARRCCCAHQGHQNGFCNLALHGVPPSVGSSWAACFDDVHEQRMGGRPWENLGSGADQFWHIGKLPGH